MFLDSSWSKIVCPVQGLCCSPWLSILPKACVWSRTEILAMSQLPALPVSDSIQTTRGGCSCSSVRTCWKGGMSTCTWLHWYLSGGETGVSISRKDWDREDRVGSPHIFPSIVNCFLAKAFYSWLCSFVFMLGIVLIVKGHGILSGKLVKAQPRGWSMNSNSQLHTAHAWEKLLGTSLRRSRSFLLRFLKAWKYNVSSLNIQLRN